MNKSNKTRTLCMNCLHSIITIFDEEYDPIGTKLVVTWSCPKCDSESGDVEYYDSQMRQIYQKN